MVEKKKSEGKKKSSSSAATTKKSTSKSEGNVADPEENIKLLKKFLKIYEQMCQSNQVKPVSSLVQRVTKLIKSEEGPSTAEVAMVVDEECPLNSLKAIIETLNTYGFYTKLSFWRASLGDEGCVVLGNWLRPHPYLKSLELIDNRLGPKSMHSLSCALQHNECLTELVLDYNDLGDDGAAILSVGVSWNPVLTKLSLRYCSIGEEGGSVIGTEIVGKSQSLQDLDLQGNPIKSNGIHFISGGLKTNKKLHTLNLADCSFGTDADTIKDLCDGLKENTTLTSLNLNLNKLSPEGAKVLLEAISSQRNLVQLRLYEKLDAELFKSIMEAIEKNRKANKPVKKKKSKKKK